MAARAFTRTFECVSSAAFDPASRLGALQARLPLLCRHLAGRALLRRVEVDDLVQETLLRALAREADLPDPARGDAELWRYVTTIARHTVIDAARAARRVPQAGGRAAFTRRGEESTAGSGASGVLARTAGAATRAAMTEDAARLRAAFERLSAEHRRVLGLRQFEGLSARETAARMGRGETAVHSLYRRALEAWDAELGRRD